MGRFVFERIVSHETVFHANWLVGSQSPLTFIFSEIVELVFRAWYVHRRGGTNI